MKQGRKTKQTMAMLLICMFMLMLAATAIAAESRSSDAAFGTFTIQGGGQKKDSPSQEKVATNADAEIRFATYSNTTSYPLYYRLRQRGTGTSVSEAYSVDRVGTQYAPYDPGKGIAEQWYFFRIQTDSHSSDDYKAVVGGYWRP